MPQKLLLPACALAILFAGGLALAQEAGDTDVQKTTYPIAELGNCDSKDSCKAYCDAEGHGPACLDYAGTHGLMSAEEIARARALMKEHEGPGGCQGTEQCRTYCNDPANLDQCTRFAKERGLVPPGGNKSEGERGKAQEAKIKAAIGAKGGPGGCTDVATCRAYCDDAAHREECVRFARESGIAPERPERGLERASERSGNPRVRELLESREGPGGCASPEACKAYCDEEAHMDECLSFAAEHDLMPAEEIERARTFARKPGPGGCQREACKTYCEDEAHADECMKFAEENGLMSKEEVQKTRSFMTKKGPGGCRGEECKRYCEDPSNREACMQFAVENGLMSAQDLERVRQMQSAGGPGGCKGADECERFCSQPANQEECRAFGERMGGQDGPPLMQEPGRFREADPESRFRKGPDAGERNGGNDRVGPGGCTGPEECQAYCAGHMDECRKFGPPTGGDPGLQRPMPGGPQDQHPPCNSQEECERMFRDRGQGPREGDMLPGSSQRPPEGGPPPERMMQGPPPGMEREMPPVRPEGPTSSLENLVAAAAAVLGSLVVRF